MSWTHLNSYTLGASSSDGIKIYAYTSSNVYFSSNLGGSFNELKYNNTSISNIQTISTNADGSKAVMGGTNTFIYEINTSNLLNITISIVNIQGTNITGNWFCSCSTNTGDNLIISENPDNPINGIDTQTYSKNVNSWGLASVGYGFNSICYYEFSSVKYYSLSSKLYNVIYYYDVAFNDSEQIYAGSEIAGVSWLKIGCSNDNNYIYALGTTSGITSLYLSTNAGTTFNVLNSITPSSTWTDVACSSNGLNVSLTGLNDNIYISSNGGNSFTPRADVQNWLKTTINSSNPAIIYASSTSGLYQSTDGGISCFEENTFILTNEGYKKINTLNVNDIIHTTEGDKKIIKIGFNYANSSNFKKLKIKTTFDFLILSNGHAVLLNDYDFTLYRKNVLHPEFYNHAQKINGYSQLLVNDCILFEPLEKEYIIKYYHFVLENENIEKQYAIHANGILCECMSEKYYEKANLINV